jgi:hypothetical protein
MPALSTATPLPAARCASTSGQRRLVSGVEPLPSVIESPTATTAPVYPGASTCTSLSRMRALNDCGAGSVACVVALPAASHAVWRPSQWNDSIAVACGR